MYRKQSYPIHVAVIGWFALAMIGSNAVGQETVACCRQGGGCDDVPTDECTSGMFVTSASMGPGTDCSMIDCGVPQECCDLTGYFCGGAPPAECSSGGAGMFPMGPGSHCSPIWRCSGDPFVDLQACCRPDGTCGMTTATSCYQSGHVPQGPDTTCAGDTDGNGVDQLCELVPCCIDGTVCGVILPVVCEEQGGTQGGEPVAGECDDCNENGIADACDLFNQTSADCSGNGIPDECEPDCNENSVADSCDILFGTSFDCNGNGVPDECAVTCEDDCECPNFDPCLYGACVDGSCVSLSNVYGDMKHDGALNVFDVLCGLAAISGDFSECAFDDVDIHPCGGNGALSVLDLLAVLDAIGGIDPCCSE